MANRKTTISITIIAIAAFGLAIAGGYLFQTILHGSEESPSSSITKVESEDDGGKSDVDVSLKYAGYATLLSGDKSITLNFTNPSKSKKSLSLEIVANVDGEDIVLANTDIIRPGYRQIHPIDHVFPRGIVKMAVLHGRKPPTLISDI